MRKFSGFTSPCTYLSKANISEQLLHKHLGTISACLHGNSRHNVDAFELRPE